MKKITNFFITIVLFVSMILYGKAENITVHDLVNKINKNGIIARNLETNETSDILDENCNFEYINPKLILTCRGKDEETNQENESKLSMDVENSIIYYRGDYTVNGAKIEKNAENVLDYLGQQISELIIFSTILENTAQLKGYPADELTKYMLETPENNPLIEMSIDETYEKFGFLYNDEEGADPKFKIDINNFQMPNFDDVVNNNNNEQNENTETTSTQESINETEITKKATKNPKTAAVSFSILTGGLTVLAVGLIVIIKNKSKFTNI